MLPVSALLVFGTVGWLFASLRPGAELVPGFEQIIHADVPWPVLVALWAGVGLGVVALVRRRRWFTWGIVGVELLLAGFLSFYFLRLSWLPEHGLAVAVGEPFPSYQLVDQDEALHVSVAEAPREPALYIFYRGDW